MAPLHVRSLRPDDLAWASSLQRAALPHGFFARLGPRFLRAYQPTFRGQSLRDRAPSPTTRGACTACPSASSD